MKNELKYQPHIDGLRALAVLAVFIFHLMPNVFPGGYLGVDVFFVISGFVISQSLYKNFLKTGTIDIGRFYVRRFMRLYPALLVMVSVTSVVYFLLGFLWDTNLFIKSSLTSIFAVSNLYFIKKGDDYFHQDLINPLLHTWSLGVEEQFYFIYPLLLFVILVFFLKLKSRELTAGLIFFFVTLILYVVFASNSDNLWGDFYWPLARFWELTAGCSLFFFTQKYSVSYFKKYLPILGLGIILAVLFLSSVIENIHQETLLVVLGTVILIFSGIDNKSATVRFLQYKPVLFIGALSYSLYLWHLPVIYFFNLYLDTFLFVVFSLLVTFVLALISFRYVESRYRNSIRLERLILGSSKPILTFSVVMVLTVPLIGFTQLSLLWNTALNHFGEQVKGFNYLEVKANLSERIEEPYSLGGINMSKYCTGKPTEGSILGSLVIDECLKNNKKETLIYLTGDSHALHLTPMIDRSLIDSDMYFQSYPFDEILNIDIAETENKSFPAVRKNQLNEFSGQYEEVFLITSFYLSSRNIDKAMLKDKFFQYINLYGVDTKLIFVAPTPVFSVGPASCVAVGVHCYMDVRLDQERRRVILNMFLEFEREYDDVHVYDPYEAICPEESCLIYDKDTNFLLYRDDDHLSVEGSMSLSSHFTDWFNKKFKSLH